jgi:hypothetical protein
MGILNEFDFTVHYIHGETNILADALSSIYANEPMGEIRAPSEYLEESDPDEIADHERLAAIGISAPILTDEVSLTIYAVEVGDQPDFAKKGRRW